MSVEEGQTTFGLTRSVNYSRGGNSRNVADSVTLIEPGMEHVKFYLRLKQMLMRCQMEFAKQSNELKAIGEQQKSLHEIADTLEDDNDETVEMFSLILMASETVDVAEFVDTFRGMVVLPGCRKPVAMLDGVQQITAALWDRLHPDDAFNMAVRWCVFFGMPSDESVKTTSEQPSASLSDLREA